MPEPTGTENTGTPAPVSTTPAAAATSAAPSAIASLEKVSAAASSAEGAQPATTTTATSAAGTTVQPGQPGANTGATGEDAEWLRIPETRRNVILENTRKKERDAVTAEFDTKHGWAKDFKREDVVEGFKFATRISQNPVQFAVDLITEIRQNPQLAPMLEAALGKAAAPAANAFRSGDGKFVIPKGRLVSDDGKTTAHSDEQVRETLTAFEQYLEEKFGSRLAPIEEAHASNAEREEVMGIIHQSRQETAQLMTELRALPHWPKGGTGSDGEKKIGTYLAAIPADTRKRIGSVGAMYQAYNTYLQNDVFPTLQSKTEQEVQNDAKRRAAAAAGSVVPGTMVPAAATKKPSNPEELARHMERLAAATA